MAEVLHKRLVILANSVKRNHWCVAGKEIFAAKAGWTPGLWVRPIDPAHEGAISVPAMRLPDARTPAFLDIVDVPILRYANDPNHPEDWIADTSRPWLFHGHYPVAQLAALLDKPTHLWKGWTAERKVRGGYIAKMLRPASLYLIKPEAAPTAQVFWDPESKRFKKQLRLRYNDHHHEFAITDPHFESRYLGARRARENEPLEISLTSPNALYLCLSLTPDFHGAHYKIAATIWEAPPA